jgi:hypothetical protein
MGRRPVFLLLLPLTTSFTAVQVLVRLGEEGTAKSVLDEFHALRWNDIKSTRLAKFDTEWTVVVDNYAQVLVSWMTTTDWTSSLLSQQVTEWYEEIMQNLPSLLDHPRSYFLADSSQWKGKTCRSCRSYF